MAAPKSSPALPMRPRERAPAIGMASAAITTVGQTALPSVEKNTARKNADASARFHRGKGRVWRSRNTCAARGQTIA